MKWQDVSDAELNGALCAVKHGHDPDSACFLVEYFYERIKEGAPYNERVLLAYLDHAFGKIIVGKWSANHAFGFELKRGYRAREDTTERDVTATAYMILLSRNGWTLLDAKGEAANLLFPDGKGDKAVEAAYSKYNKAFRAFSSEELVKILPEGTLVIKRDMTG